MTSPLATCGGNSGAARARAGTEHGTRDGTCVRDYIHVTDLVAAHVLAARHLANPPAVYNVGTGRGVSVREFVEACRGATGERIAVREQREARPGDYAEVGPFFFSCAETCAGASLGVLALVGPCWW